MVSQEGVPILTSPFVLMYKLVDAVAEESSQRAARRTRGRELHTGKDSRSRREYRGSDYVNDYDYT